MNGQDKKAVLEWENFIRAFGSRSEVDPFEERADRRRRIKSLEKEPEAWFKYYFDKYCTAPPAPFHTRSTRRILANPEWYEVRAWSRELAKSVRTMMEVCYLVLTKRKHTILLISNSQNNAERLLAPYREFFERSERMINDYGRQDGNGLWTSTEFRIRAGATFRALGAGQSPRGSRNEQLRPDVILVDDIDTDEDCRNPEIIARRWDWFEQALYPTRSISSPLLVVFCGNIIAEDCCIRRAIRMADHTDIVNIRDGKGRSTWPEKNSEEDIDRTLSKISIRTQQGEYFNNPYSEGTVFKEVRWGKIPPLSAFRFLVAYADPATSNKDKKGSCTKAVVLLGLHKGVYYVLRCRVDNASNDTFVQWFYDLRDWVASRSPVYYYIENNTLQDPFYSQVFIPLFAAKGKASGDYIGITPDTRRKPDKFARIEGGLEPLVRTGLLVFNEAERGDPHMQRLEQQFRAVTPKLSAPVDGVDATEGGIFIIRQKMTAGINQITYIPQPVNHKRF